MCLKIDVELLKNLSQKVKLSELTILRLIDLIVYSHMESKVSNPTVHNYYRILVKKRLYLRCMKLHPELFEGKKLVLERKS